MLELVLTEWLGNELILQLRPDASVASVLSEEPTENLKCPGISRHEASGPISERCKNPTPCPTLTNGS